MSVAAKATAEEDVLRADLYDLLGTLLARPPSAEILGRVSGLAGDQSELGSSFAALARLARQMTPEAVKAEFDALFIGLVRGELLPYASYYQTGFLNEKPLGLLRRDMARLGIARAENVYEPEDNIASLCEMMAGLIRGRFLEPAPVKLQRAFFERHLAPWAKHFFSDVEAAKSADLYRPAGTIGRLFIEVETAAFGMAE